MNSPYACNSFVEFICMKAFGNSSPQRGDLNRLATAAGCQASYLTQVLKRVKLFTLDHAMGLAEFFHLNAEETEFSFKLLMRDRAATRALRKYLTDEIEKISAHKLSVPERIEKFNELNNTEEMALYCSNVNHSLIHICVSIPEFRSPVAIANRLNISLEDVQESLDTLQKLGLVMLGQKLDRKSMKHYLPTKKSIHSPSTSPFYSVHARNLRILGLSTIKFPVKLGDLHYSAIHSLSKADLKAIRERLLEAIESTRAIVEPSAEEELAVIVIDFLTI